MTEYEKGILRSYLDRSLADLGLSGYLGVALASPKVEEVTQFLRTLVAGSRGQTVSKQDWDVLERPEDYYQSAEPDEAATLQFIDQRIRRFRSMRAAMVLALLGDERGVAHLGSQLVTEPLNWKLMISHFLGNLTGGQIGSLTEEIPTRSQVVRWATAIRKDGFAREAVLPSLRWPDHKVS